jgi:hypothetical protein
MSLVQQFVAWISHKSVEPVTDILAWDLHGQYSDQ